MQRVGSVVVFDKYDPSSRYQDKRKTLKVRTQRENRSTTLRTMNFVGYSNYSFSHVENENNNICFVELLLGLLTPKGN